MTSITLYRFARPDGGVTVTPNRPTGVEYTEKFRLVADDGKALTKDGTETFSCVDVDAADGWYEIDDPVPEEDAE